MFDDDSSWDGLSGVGSVTLLAGWGLSAWFLFGLGNQQGIESASKCSAEVGCTVKTAKGMFGVEYKVIQHQAAAASDASK